MNKEKVFRLALAAAIFFMVFQFGFKPFLDFSNAPGTDTGDKNWASKALVKNPGRYHVMVVGDEPDGIAAAVSAARLGATTLLVSFNDDMSGLVGRSKLVSFSPAYGQDGDLLNQGILKEFIDKLGSNFSIEKYKTQVKKLTEVEENLSVVYAQSLKDTTMKDNTITGVKIVENGKEKTILAERIIDATWDGKLLKKAHVPYLTGSEDLNLKKSFMPVWFNFEIEGIKAKEAAALFSGSASSGFITLQKYKFNHMSMRINGLKMVAQDDKHLVIQGLQVANVNVLDEEELKMAYKDAALEADNLIEFLKSNLKKFEKAKISKKPAQLFIPEHVHFAGEYMLGVNEILSNMDSDLKAAVSSHPIQGTKFTDGLPNVIGSPVQYSVPLGCLVPLRVENLMMTGGKASYSSLASTSAASMSVGIATGEAAGTAAVLSLVKKITPRELAKTGDEKLRNEFVKHLRNQGMVLPDFKGGFKAKTGKSEAEIKKLLSMGLIAGGYKNDYSLSKNANQKDLALLLLNGIYRVSPEKYSIQLDARLRKLFENEQLTPLSCSKIVCALYGETGSIANTYTYAISKGYINNQVKDRIEDKKVLTMEDVYFTAVHIIEAFTGKTIDL